MVYALMMIHQINNPYTLIHVHMNIGPVLSKIAMGEMLIWGCKGYGYGNGGDRVVEMVVVVVIVVMVVVTLW